MTGRAAVLAVDGGNSKTDLALVAADGALLARVRGPTTSHQQVELGVAMERLADLAREASRAASAELPASVGSYCIAGADFPSDVRTLERAIAALGLAGRSVVRNDAFAALRAGTESGWGVVVICGAGVNAVGRGPSGKTARLAGIGDLSGDWGGGYGLGVAALGAAVRARDGRGPRTVLAELVPRHFGLTRPADVARRLYEARVDARRLEDVAPIVFDAAGEGDAVARGIVDRLADELAVMAIAIARQLHVTRLDFDIVLTGGVFNAVDRPFYARLTERVAGALPRARLRRLTAPPVFGSALLGLDMLGTPSTGAISRLSDAMLAGRPATADVGG